jgi:hypothetical protein
MRYPPSKADLDDGDPFNAVFAAQILSLTILPLAGPHHMISFPSGGLPPGTYVIEADGRQDGSPAEVSVLFVPGDGLNKRLREGLFSLRQE